jgi:hypothetical protein
MEHNRNGISRFFLDQEELHFQDGFGGVFVGEVCVERRDGTFKNMGRVQFA